VRAQEGFVSAAVAADRPGRRARLRSNLGTGAFWLLGSAVVALAQPGTDRRLAAVGTAAVAIGAIVVVSVLTADAQRRYFRALVAGMIAVPVASTWLLEHLMGTLGSFAIGGLETRIGLPLMFVLFAPLTVRALPDDFHHPRALWRTRSLLWPLAQPMDWIMVAYAALVAPALVLGIAHHASKTYMAQDLGLVVFFVFMYLAGRSVATEAVRTSAEELVGALLLLAVANQLFLGGVTPPLYTYLGAACAAAVGFLVLRPRGANLVLVGLAVVLLISQAVAVRQGSGSTTAIELAGALGIVAYLTLRRFHLAPQWLVVALAVVSLVGFVGFTSDGRTLQGRYQGPDPSNTGRTFEAQQIRDEAKSSKLSLLLGRGLGATIDETGAPVVFQQSLLSGGRDLAHVQEVHLLAYGFLLKNGLLGFAWLGAFVLALGLLFVRVLETASTQRDPTLVVYSALPIIGLTVGLAAATHLQVNPLNGFAIGVIATCVARERAAATGRKRARALRVGIVLPAAAVICLVGGAVFFTRPFVVVGAAGGPTKSARVDDVRFDYPLDYHVRSFSTSDPAITGVRGTRVHGVVVASYPLKPHPEVSGLDARVGASGAALRPDGVLFELYRAPRQQPGHVPRPVALPLTVPDFDNGLLFFRANGHNYWAIVWVGKNVTAADRSAINSLIVSVDLE
jgi:hypothetical protein